MTTAYTSLLGLALPVTGELSGTWGDVVNTSITSLLDSAIAGTTTLSSDVDVTLTTTQGAANTSREAIILWTAGGTVTRTITVPAQSKIYTVINKTSSTQSIKIVGAGPTTGVTIIAGESAVVAWNGVDFIKISNISGAGVFSSITNTGLTSGRVVYSTTGGLETDSANLTFNGTTLTANTLNLTNQLTTAYGGTGLTSFTANAVLYASSTSALATGTALTFDGTRFGVGSAANAGYNAAFVSQVGSDTGTSGVMIRGADGYLSFDSGVAGFGTTGIYGNAGGGTSANSYLTFRQNATEGMRLTSTGLGIGTSSPAAKLQVSGGRSYFFSGSAYSVALAQTVGQANYMYLGTNTSGDFLVSESGGSAIATLTQSGNLGLGVTPSALAANYTTVDIRGTSGGALRFGNATDSAYIYSDSNETNLSTATNKPLLFGINATEQMRLTSTGLGIGTSSPGAKLHVAASGSQLRLGGTNTAFYWDISREGVVAGNLEFGNANGGALTTRMTLDSSGNLGIGTTSPSARLNVAAANPTNGALALIQNTSTSGQTGALLWLDVGNVGSSAVGIPGGSSNALAFYVGGITSASERARIDSSGNLLVGTTDNAGVNTGGFELYDGSGASRLYIGHVTGTANGTQYVVFNYNGTNQIGSISQSGTTAVLYNVTSDQRLKENIADADSASVLIDSLQVRKFDWKADGNHQRYGFVAQELVTVAPEAVHQPADPEQMMAVDYSKLVPMLVKEIQSLRKRLADAGI